MDVDISKGRLITVPDLDSTEMSALVLALSNLKHIEGVNRNTVIAGKRVMLKCVRLLSESMRSQNINRQEVLSSIKIG